MNALTVLKNARELIADPAKWTQGASCRDTAGIEHMALHESGVCWCLYGAMAQVAGTQSPNGWNEMWESLGSDPIRFNDTHTHAEVLTALDTAILRMSSYL